MSMPPDARSTGPVALTPIDAPPTFEELTWWEAQSTQVYAKLFGIRCVSGGGFMVVAGLTRGFLGATDGFHAEKAMATAAFGLIAVVLVSGVMVASEARKERDKRIRQRRIRAALAPDHGGGAAQALANESPPRDV